MAEEIGFQVEVLRPARTTELAKIYKVLNSSDVMIGVHGAAMTHFLFLKLDSVFIQIIPLGTDWAAEAYYGEPAKKMGLRYIGYKILPNKSSLYDEYDSNDAVLTDPNSVNKRYCLFVIKKICFWVDSAWIFSRVLGASVGFCQESSRNCCHCWILSRKQQKLLDF